MKALSITSLIGRMMVAAGMLILIPGCELDPWGETEKSVTRKTLT